MVLSDRITFQSYFVTLFFCVLDEFFFIFLIFVFFCFFFFNCVFFVFFFAHLIVSLFILIVSLNASLWLSFYPKKRSSKSIQKVGEETRNTFFIHLNSRKKKRQNAFFFFFPFFLFFFFVNSLHMSLLSNL